MRWLALQQEMCRFVVTPNLDHLVQLRTNDQLARAYREADMVVADGMPLVWISRLLGTPLPERVSGPTLAYSILDQVARSDGFTICLLGGRSGVAQDAARAMTRLWPRIRNVHAITPCEGFSYRHETNEVVLEKVNAARPDLLMIGLGAPTQEEWAHASRWRLNAKVILCVGNTIDILAGHQPRAPAWMQRAGLEFAHRLLLEPRRLWKRYLVDALHFPLILIDSVLRHAFRKAKSSRASSL